MLASRRFCQLSRQGCRRMWAEAAALLCDENGERGCHTTEMKQTAADCGSVLVVAGARAEVVAEFVVGSTVPVGRGEALEPTHTSDPTFDAPVILLEPVIPVSVGTVSDPLAQS